VRRASIVVTSALVPPLSRGPVGALMDHLFGACAPLPAEAGTGGLFRPADEADDDRPLP